MRVRWILEYIGVHMPLEVRSDGKSPKLHAPDSAPQKCLDVKTRYTPPCHLLTPTQVSFLLGIAELLHRPQFTSLLKIDFRHGNSRQEDRVHGG